MKPIKTPAGWLLRLDPGEAIIKTLEEFTEKNSIPGATFTAIGAVCKAELSYFSPNEKRYYSKAVEGDLEITSLAGNIGWFDGKPLVHAHINLGKKDFSVVGGHLVDAVVSATCEIILAVQGKIKREINEEIGLKLIK